MQDILLQKLFETERWTAAIDKGMLKGIRKDQLFQLTKPSVRANIFAAIRDGRYTIAPPHAALIPKDTPGEFRRVFVNEPIDRVLLSLINDLLFELCPDMIHPRCRSYLKGTGCGETVQDISRIITDYPETVIGWKSDLSKYFDSVPMRYIDRTFRQVKERTGPSAVLDLLVRYYHSDYYFDEDGNLVRNGQSLKQGCAVAAFLADAILYDLDEKLCSAFEGHYTRYSDDMLFLGGDHRAAMRCLQDELAKMDMTLNPRKVEPIRKDRWFKFLGFSIRGKDISLSSSRIKSFQREIESRTTRDPKATPQKALNRVNRFLYQGNGEHSWATQVLRVINVPEDINTLNAFVLDCLRAVTTRKTRTGGLGYSQQLRQGCIARGRGRNVTANREKTPGRIEGYRSIACMRNALLTSRSAFNTLVATL